MRKTRTEIRARSPGSSTELHSETSENTRIRIKWSCPICDESIRFHPHDIDLMDYFAARHLVRKHNREPVEAATYASQLRERMAEWGPALDECQASDGNGHANHPQD